MEYGNKTVGDLIAFLQNLPKDALLSYSSMNSGGDVDTGICQSFEVKPVKERTYILGDKPYSGYYKEVDCIRLMLDW